MLGPQRREDVIKFIYKINLLNQSSFELEGSFVFGEYKKREFDDQAKQMIRDLIEKKEQILIELNKHLTRNIKLMPVVNQAIILVSGYELMFSDLDKRIIIDEALRITEKYSDLPLKKVTNAVLDKVTR